MRSTHSFIERVIASNNSTNARRPVNQHNRTNNNNGENGVDPVGGANNNNNNSSVPPHQGHNYYQNNEGRGMSLNRAAILGGLPLHQASMIAQESRLMNHQDEEYHGNASMYSSSFAHGATLGGTRINGGGNSGLANSALPGHIMRTNTISHQPQNTNNFRNGAGNQGQNGAGVGLLANNIFMNDSAPNLFQPVNQGVFTSVAARSNSLVPPRNEGNNGNSFNHTGDALDEFMQQQHHIYNNNLSNTGYGGIPGPSQGLFGSQNQVISPQFVRPHYTATYGGGGTVSSYSNSRGGNSLAQAGAAILGQAQPNALPRRGVTTVSDFEVGFLGSNSSHAGGNFGLIGNPSVGASRIRDESDDRSNQQNQPEGFSPYQMNSRLQNHLDDDEEDDFYQKLLDQHNRERQVSDFEEHERQIQQFSHLSQSHRNFVESLVDDILARNHQINQLHMAQAIGRTSEEDNQEENESISQLRGEEEREINEIIEQQLRQQQDLLGINPHIIDNQRLSSEEEQDMEDDDSAGGSGMSSTSSEQSDLNNRQHEEEEYYLEQEDDDRHSRYNSSNNNSQQSGRPQNEAYQRFQQYRIDVMDEEEVDAANILQAYHQGNPHAQLLGNAYEEDEFENEEDLTRAQQLASLVTFNRNQVFNEEDEDEEEEEDDDREEDNNDDQEMEEQEEDEDIQNDEQEQSESELQQYLRDIEWGRGNRAKTAPLKPAKHTEQFKLTPGFTQLEQAAVCAVQLVQRGDMKFDLDSFEGQNSCKKFLGNIEKLCESVEAKCQNRQYRKKFSNAYKVLYKEGKLCYLTEILDSAQEAFPYLWVNGEKYVFSKEVIEAGRNLFNNFCKILYQVKDAYQRVCQENQYEALLDVISEVREALEDFDMNWVTYEQLYVIELMLIEQDARRYITEAIEIEKEISSAEVREKAKGKIIVDCPEYKKNRSKLIGIFNKINAVANPEGKGRDDLQPEILFTAETLCRKITLSQSKAVRKLAEAIRKTFMAMRTLLRKYEENIEGVDPQLKNNADLVAALVEFEQSWEKGKTYFVNEQKCQQLLHFTQIIEGTSEKYKSFFEQIEDRDTVIFVTIPALLILKNLDDGDDKGICKTFFPPMFGHSALTEDDSTQHIDDAFKKYQDLRQLYITIRQQSKNAYDFYNFIEKSVLEMEESENSSCTAKNKEESLVALGMDKGDLQKLVQQIRLLSMQLQRHKPAEWNEFLDVAL